MRRSRDGGGDPLGAESVDAVTVAQAFHWFRGDEALAEIHRVLRPGGGLGLIWNVRERAALVARLTEIMEPYRGDAPAYRSGAWREAFERTTFFGPLEHAEFRHDHELTPKASSPASLRSASSRRSRSASARPSRRGPGLLATGLRTRGRGVSSSRTEPTSSGQRRYVAAADDRQAPGLAALEELVGVDLVEPAEEVASGSSSVEP